MIMERNLYHTLYYVLGAPRQILRTTFKYPHATVHITYVIFYPKSIKKNNSQYKKNNNQYQNKKEHEFEFRRFSY